MHHRLNQEAEAKRLEKERLEKERLEAIARAHSFAPQINENSRSMVSMRSFVQQSPDGTGSVAADDIFTRLNAQTIIAKSPHIAEAALANQSPSKARSIVLSEKEHAELYDRLSAPPRTLSFQVGTKNPEDDRASSANRRSQQEIDSVIQRLHATHTKAMKADPFEVPPPLETQLRSSRGSFSGATSPNVSPDKSYSRRNSMSNMDLPSPPPMSFAPSPVVGGVKRSMSMSASPPSGLARAASVKTMIPLSPTATSAPAPVESAPAVASAASSSSMRRVSSTRNASSSSSNGSVDVPSAPKVVPRKAKEESATSVAPPAAAPTVSAPSVAAPAPPVRVASAKPFASSSSSSSSRGGGGAGGDDFLSKIEASMNMLTMNPADIVAQQSGVARASPPVTTVPTPAPVPATVVQTPAPVIEQQPGRKETASLAAESQDLGSDEEVEVVEDEEDL